jgi:hypothetical protein
MWSLVALLAAQTLPVMPGSPGLPPPRYTQAQVCEGTEPSSRPHGGVLDIRLGEPIAAALARSTFRFRPEYAGSSIQITGDRLDLRFRDGDRVLDLPGLGGMHNTILDVNEFPGEGISLISFWYQGRPLTLAEALDRAEHLRRWFGEGRFRALPAAPSVLDSRGFRTTSAPNALATSRDRARAEALLRDEARAIPEMELFRLKRGRQEIQATLQNWRRLTAVMTRGGASIFDACQGREWGVEVYVSTR